MWVASADLDCPAPPCPRVSRGARAPGGIDTGIDDQMRDMDVFRPELARHRLRHGAQAKLRAGKGRKAAAAAERRGRASEEDIALASRQHQPRRFAARDKAGPAGHFPYFPKHTVSGLQNRKIDIGADIEDADLQRRVLVGVIEEGRRLLFLPGVERAAEDRAARGLVALRFSMCCSPPFPLIVIPGWSEGPDPESRDSGFDASHRPGMIEAVVISPRPSPRLRATAPCRRTFRCRQRRSASRTRRARPPIACSRSASP